MSFNPTSEKTESRKVNFIPEGYGTVTPYLIVKNAAGAIDFYKRALDAEELYRINSLDGRVGHAELLIGNSHLMIADEHPEMGAQAPESYGGSPISFMIYVEDADVQVEKALQEGASLQRPVKDEFYGDRMGCIKDPYGYSWFIATHIEDIDPVEMQKRSNEREREQRGDKLN